MPRAEKAAELKLCPFCGGKAEIEEMCGPTYSIGCTKCTAEILEIYFSEEDCVEAWNNRYEPPNPPLTLEELRELPVKEWVWVENIEPNPNSNGSAYYCKIDAIRPELMFECGYPGWGTAFRYENYGKAWLAYRRRPEDISKKEAQHG